ncbi:MAG: sodium:calcium antiporter [candidate division Zixibacteria bacterium]
MSLSDRNYQTPPGLYLAFIVTALVTFPGVWLGFSGTHVSPILGSILFGAAIFGAAFILSWAAEAAQIDISQSLAIAIMALLAVLPEYAVDFVFTWKAAHDPEQAHYAIANMTGANRLLVGLGWPVILFLYIWATKKKELILKEHQRVEIFYLAAATLYSFTIPLKGSLNLIDTVILVTLYGLYVRRVAKMESEEPDLVGPVKIVANMKNIPRRICTALMFLFAGMAIFAVAEPFAVSLVDTGGVLGIDKFLLVQWLAPLASEAPEFIIVATWSLRGQAGAAMKAIISSKVNQWTLLVGTIPLVYAISGQSVKPFALDSFQNAELFLTAAQSLFGVALLICLKFNRTSGMLLLLLFLSQLIVQQIRMEVAVIYMVFAAIYIFKARGSILPTIKTGLFHN